MFNQLMNKSLPYDIEHIYPDYSLYNINDAAYGFMSRGCPRGCDFCIVAKKEGRYSYKVADLSEFWNGQKNIELLDPNTFACKDWKDILQQLIDSKAHVNFNQGVDLRCLNEEKISYLMRVKVKGVHFAFDRFEDWNIIVPKLEQFKSITGWNRQKVTVYVLTNFNTTIEQDILRVEKIKELGFMPYVMRYDKEHIKRGSEINKLARYANNKFFYNIKSFDEYKKLLSSGELR